ncbi:cap-specific mRNA (nucleoside-2'-O-)-methyltransferase 2-like [Aphis craccivora]|uniref:Cap-specific mRNA (Nucleoside-2'-O-)-methyltransferase 2-like n=1 Tax=Aphis craccivora TaxID=307492 RepID=A0A6G0X9A9_APHCR|nr:cap-specific mRNA (nucleoside-2'-O-)-methyltransferase 2-like [Aphis craccivora]
MEVDNRNLGTAPGDSDPQVTAVVGGSGVTAGSNVTGPLRWSSDNREGAGVASQAPATLAATSAETVVLSGTQPPPAKKEDPLETALNVLKYQLIMQQGGTKVLVQRANALQNLIADSKSSQVQSAIGDVMEAVECSKTGLDKVARAYKAMSQQIIEQQDPLDT